MTPLLFGPSSRPLYGVLEVPRGVCRSTGVVLLYPGVQEYLRAHWAFRSLATALAAKGFAVLRFDYRGVGDSAGGPESTTFEACVEDALTAAEELRQRKPIERVTLLGMRLGAVVALEASRALRFVDRVFLWNPIVRGIDYLVELERMDQAARIRLLHWLPRAPEELGGYAFPRAVRDSIERIDLSRPRPDPARRFEIFAQSVSEARCASCDRATPSLSAQSTAACVLCAGLSRVGQRVRPHGVSDGGDAPAFPDATLLAPGAIATLVARATEMDT